MKYQHFNCYIFLYNGWMRGPGTPCNHTPSWQWTKDLWYYSFGLCPHSGRSLHLKQHPGDRGSSGHCISTFSSHKREGKGTQIYPTDHNLLSHRNLPIFFLFFSFSCKERINLSVSAKLPGYICCVRPEFSLLKPSFPPSEDNPWKTMGITWACQFQVEFYLEEKHDSVRIPPALFLVLLDNKLECIAVQL